MARRPLFTPNQDNVGVKTIDVDFRWHSGFALLQKQKSINEFHSAAKEQGMNKILEVSTKSLETVGIELSAFNLTFTTKKYQNTITVETAFQGSKVFQNGGPFTDLFGLDSKSAKRDERLKDSGPLISFRFFGIDFPLIPRTYFYDWLYINALAQSEYRDEILLFDGFTDIEFNPKKSLNCQAHSVALFVSLYLNNALDSALKSPKLFLEVLKEYYLSR